MDYQRVRIQFRYGSQRPPIGNTVINACHCVHPIMSRNVSHHTWIHEPWLSKQAGHPKTNMSGCFIMSFMMFLPLLVSRVSQVTNRTVITVILGHVVTCLITSMQCSQSTHFVSTNHLGHQVAHSIFRITSFSFSGIQVLGYDEFLGYNIFQS